MIKKIVKSLLQFPADALIVSSKRLPGRLDTHTHNAILGNTRLSAKFYPYQADCAAYLLPKVSRDQTLPIPPLAFGNMDILVMTRKPIWLLERST